MYQERELRKVENSNVINKTLYKAFLTLLKYTPFVLAFIDVLYTILAYYDVNAYFLNYFGSVSVIFLVNLYMLSYVFLFCNLFRIPLYYITATNIIATIDSHIGIPLSDLNMLRSYFIVLGISILSYFYLKYKKRC